MTDTPFTRRNVLRAVGAGAVAGGLSTGVAGAVHRTWRAHLRPTVDGSRGQGNFELKRVQNHLEFGLQSANLTSDVKMAHIHHRNGGAPVLWLYSDVDFHPDDATEEVIDPGAGDAFVAGGSFTADDLVGVLDGATLDDLVADIENGQTFVRVHTAEHLGGEVQGDLG